MGLSSQKAFIARDFLRMLGSQGALRDLPGMARVFKGVFVKDCERINRRIRKKKELLVDPDEGRRKE